MSCNTCRANFTFLLREHGCPNCGFSYCTRCLRYKYNLPDLGKVKICGKCYHKLSDTRRKSSTTMENSHLPIDPLVPVEITKQLESLENPAKPPIVVYKHGGGGSGSDGGGGVGGQRWDNFKSGLEPADQEIVERLRKLRDEDKMGPVPTVEEIRERLAILKGENPEIGRNDRKHVFRVDTRTDEQKTGDLLNEYLDRLKISQSHDPCDEIQARLNSLRGVDVTAQSKHREDDDDDEEAVTKKIIKKALAEANLQAKYGDTDELEEMEVQGRQSDDEDLESCVMCEQTKNLVHCRGCNNDLYCSVCFEDNHDEFEMKYHRTVPYRPGREDNDDDDY